MKGLKKEKDPVGHLANITMRDYVRNNYGNSLNDFSGSCVHLHLVQNHSHSVGQFFFLPSQRHIPYIPEQFHFLPILSKKSPYGYHIVSDYSSAIMSSEAGPSSIRPTDDKGKRKRPESPSQEPTSRKVNFLHLCLRPCH